ncbi:fimbria/pilus outer membrane usher protein [Aeromonas salmonicida]|uniref:fimbria/pilus outer membrane usher protein n=1 Tax=Aeromonas salmonicida TaxID=645 RepID=UPI003F7B40E2
MFKLLLGMCIVVNPVFSANFDFNLLPNPIQDAHAIVNNEMLPGIYDVVINVNSISYGEVKVRFIESDGKTVPCVNMEFLQLIGVESGRRDLSFNQQGCIVPEHGIIEYQYDDSNMSINFFLNKKLIMTDYEQNMKHLDHGINALRISYDAATQVITSSNSSGSKGSSFLALSSHANVNAWRFVSNANITKYNSNKLIYNGRDMYIYRPIVDSKSVMYFGKKSTQQNIFESRYFTGAEYIIEPRLYSPYENVAVPSISVVLLTNSVVRMYQKKQKFYESYFFAGSHEINDYIPISQSDIDVEIEGDDGNIIKLNVPNRVSSGMLKSSSSLYYISGGVDSNDDNTSFIMASYQYAFADWLSVTYGADVSNKVVSLGVAADTSLGIYGESRVKIVSDVDKNYVDVSYHKSFSELSTDLRMSHRSFMYDNDNSDLISQTNSISLYTAIPNSAVSANVGLTENNYTRSGSRMQGIVGLSGGGDDVKYNINYTRTLKSDLGKDAESIVGLSVSVPLNLIGLNRGSLSRVFSSKGSATSLSTSGIHDKGDWTAYVSKQDTISTPSLGAATTYHTGISEIKAFASTSPSSDSMRVGAKGGVLFSEYGMKLTERMSETIMLIHTPDVEGIKYTQDKYESSNTEGLAIVDNIKPYGVARATIDVNNIPDNVELPNLSTTGVASQGAVLYKKLLANTGLPLLIELSGNSAIEVPFGARVNIDGYSNPIVAEGDGTIFIPALPLYINKIDVVWKTGACQININKDYFVNGHDFSHYIAPCD